MAPAFTPKARESSSTILGAFLTWQAVPMQTVTICFPLGSRLNALKKVAMLYKRLKGTFSVSDDLHQRGQGQVVILRLDVLEDADKLGGVRAAAFYQID